MFRKLRSIFIGTIRRTLISIIVFALLIPMLIITLISFKEVQQGIYQSELSKNRQIIQQISQYFQLYFDNIDSLGLDVYRNPLIYNALALPASNSVMVSIDDKNDFFLNLMGKDSDAACLRYRSYIDDYEVIHARQVTVGNNYVLRPNRKSYFESFFTVPQNSLSFEAPRIIYPYSTQEADFLVYYRVIYNVLRREPVGELYIVVQTDFLAEACDSYSINPSDVLALYSLRAERCIYANDQMTAEFLEASSPLFAQAQQGDVFERIRTNDDIMLTFLSQIPGYDIVACKAVANSTLQTQPSDALLLLIPIAIFAILLAILFSREIVRPIGQLREAMQRVQQGEYRHRIESQNTSDNEVLSAVHAFNQMTQEIDRLINESLLTQINLQQARINELQATINPHFISNTLQSISGMAVRHNAYDVKYALEIFSDLIRYCISGDPGGVPLKSELLHARKYLILHKLRLGDRLEFHFDVSPETENIPVPRLTLQPLIENCIRYGQDATERTLTIRISAAWNEGALTLDICDDGAGFSEHPQAVLARLTNASAAQPHRHIGLGNVCERLRHMYGDRFSMDITSEPYRQTCVKITIQTEIKP